MGLALSSEESRLILFGSFFQGMDGQIAKSQSANKRWPLVILLLALMPVTGWAWYVWAGGNFHVVKADRLYRCSQPKGGRLQNLVAEHQIKTVINLRGCCDPVAWYRDEARTIQEMAISLEDISLSALRLPPPAALARLVELFDHAEEPLLIHCHQGIDRTGMACALWLLLKTDTTLQEAIKQLNPYFGHFPVGRTGWMDEFFYRYRQWLASQGKPHEPDLLREWLARVYCPGPMRAAFTWQQPPPSRVEAGKPFTAQIRCTNTSNEAWTMLPATNAGIHLIWRLQNDSRMVIASGPAGLFERTVEPGESVDLLISCPPVEEIGSLVLRAGMDNPQHSTFAQVGNAIAEATIEVVPKGKANE